MKIFIHGKNGLLYVALSETLKQFIMLHFVYSVRKIESRVKRGAVPIVTCCNISIFFMRSFGSN